MAAGSLNLENARTLLRTIIRSIDKRAEVSLSLKEGERPAVAANLTLRGNRATVMLPVDQINAAATDAIARNQLRTKIKRTMDLMSFKEVAIADTKMLQGRAVEGGYFRTQSGNRGGGRR